MEHEGQQPPNFCFTGHELQKDSREPDRLFGEVPAALVGARHIVPPDAKGGVNRFKHRVEPLRQFMLLRDFELNTAVTDLRLGTHQALTHCCG